MPRRRGRHVRETGFVLLWSDDGSFSAALVVAACLGVGILSLIGSQLLG